jgi:tRNA 2-thiocytidine biosynthesis protein TtcA
LAAQGGDRTDGHFSSARRIRGEAQRPAHHLLVAVHAHRVISPPEMHAVAQTPAEGERLERRLLSDVGRAIGDFGLLEEGDRVMVAVSGGKDSYTLLQLLELLRRRAPVRFTLLAVNLDQGHPGYPGERLEGWLSANGFAYRMLKEDTYTVVQSKIESGKTLCSLCSRLRRGILYNAAESLGCNKIALGHHRDDLIETLLLNLFFSGRMSAMPALLRSDDGRNTVIRPLCYAAEADIARYAELKAFPLIPCDLCGSQEQLQRKRVKALLDALAEEHPRVRESLAASLGNVRPSHLLDRTLWDPQATSAGTNGDEKILRVLGAD